MTVSEGAGTYAGGTLFSVDVGEAGVRFDERGLVTVVVQQHDTGEVLMVAWANEEALRLTFETGTSWFWSRSRRELWNKGATSGHYQKIVSVSGDCDDDTLLIRVEQTGAACHTGRHSCFYQPMAFKKFKE